MPEPLPPYAKQWMEQWRYAARELPKIKARELRELTDERSIELLGQHDDICAMSSRSCYENGLVIQQRWFTRWRVLQLQSELDRCRR